MRLSTALLLVCSFGFLACAKEDNSGGGIPPYTCNTKSYSSGVYISGNADYQFRTNGNGIVNATALPIRNAEIKIYNASGTIIQCTYTDSNGAFNLLLPESSSQHKIRISSIIYNSITKAFVYNNPSQNTAHYIESSFTPDSTKSVGTLRASATGDIKGGAFNILDKIHSANEYLYTETTNCSATFSPCTPFTGSPEVKIYWDKGVNPGSYFNAGPVSFYIPGDRELYILGGEDGDTDSSDCDHFDNSVILHEYGHFIEDVFSETDSPGGSHSGDSIIDARLAWGEGWANFFQAAILDNPRYRDTSGNIAGSTTVFFNEDLETPDNDIPSTLGEGNFREFSITRLLWDAIDSNNEGAGVDDVTSPFSELWTVFTSPTAGFKSTSYRFRNIGLFHTIQQNLVGGSDWSSIRTGEKHAGSQVDYARPVSIGGVCAATVIEAANISAGQPENGSVANSNHFASNDFYQIYHAGGSFSWQLSYSTDNTSSADLDIYLYKESYTFGSNAVASSTANIANGTTNASEAISLSSLPAGYYMLNVRVDTGVRRGGSSSYTMTLGGQSLCPN